MTFHRELLDKCREKPPAGIELTALAAFLHSLYTGIENLFRRIAIELDGELPRESDWHRRLLRSMTRPAAERPAVISEALHDQLLGYLDFRHLFRNLYLFRLEWERIEALVLGVDELMVSLGQNLDRFLRSKDA